MKCLCGKEAVGYMLVPNNIYAGLRQLKDEVPICEYHKGKAIKKGIEVIGL